MSEEVKELTDFQKKAKEALDAEIAGRRMKLQGELDALGNLDTEKIARKIGEEKAEEAPQE